MNEKIICEKKKIAKNKKCKNNNMSSLISSEK